MILRYAANLKLTKNYMIHQNQNYKVVRND